MKISSDLRAFSCDDCGVVSFEIPNALDPGSDVVCSHCGAALGTLGSLQDLAERLLQRIERSQVSDCAPPKISAARRKAVGYRSSKAVAHARFSSV